MTVTLDLLLRAVVDGLVLSTVLVLLVGVIHFGRLIAGCPRSERECITDAWSALRARWSHTRPSRTASGRRGQA